MTHKRRATRLFLTACVAGGLAFCLPVAGALYVAWAQGHDEAKAVLDQLATDILRRASTLRQQTNDTIDHLAAASPDPACSEADLDRMREAGASASYLQGVGRIQGHTLLCSTLTGHHTLELGPPDRTYTLPGTPLAWDSVQLSPLSAARFSLYARDGYAGISLPELIADTALPPGVVVGQFAVRDRKVMRANGTIDDAWLQRFDGTETSYKDDNGHLVTVRLSKLGFTAAVAAMPAEMARTYVQQATGRALPAGLAVGTLLALLIGLRTRYLLSMKARLIRALQHKEFHLVYQPVMDLRNGTCVGAEALIRWSPPGEAMVSPVVFIPEAENHGLIQQVTAQVMEMVARDAAALLSVYPDAHIAINFSADDLHSPETEARLKELLAGAGAQSHNILIEATERGLMKPEKAKGTLLSVRSQGFKVAIDDFGTGSSSLSYLATYDLDVLKIDKMFVDSFEHESPTTKVAFHIIEIARTLGLEMIAEGVETERQRDVLRDAGVQYAQGWLFARPMPMQDLVRFMREANGG